MKKKLLTLMFTLVLLIGLVAAVGMNASAAENYLITNSEFAKTENDIIQSAFFRPNSDGTFNIGVNVDIRHVESQYVDRYFVGMGYYYYDNANKLYSGGYGIDTSKRVFDLTNVVKNAKSGEKYKIKIYLSEDYHGDYEWRDYDFTFFEVEVPDFKVGGVEAVGTGIEYDNIKGEYTPVFTTLKSVDIGGVYTGYEVESYGLYKERDGVQLSDQLTTAPVEGETYYTALSLKNPEGNHHIEKNLVNITIPGYTVEFLQAYERDMGFSIRVVYSVTKDYQKVSGVEAVARGIEYNSTISGYVPIFTTLKSVGVDGTYTGYEVQVYGLYKTRNGVQLSDQLTTAPVAGETYYTALSLKNPEGNHHIEKNLVNITIPGYTVEFLQAYERDMGFSIRVVYSVTHKTHIGGTATCTNKAKCTVCGKEYGSLAGHSYNAATCTKAKTCKVCKATTGKANGHNSKTTIPAVAATYTKTGLTEGKKCSACGTVTVEQQTVAKKVLGKVTGLKTKAVKLASGTKSTLTLAWTKVADAEKYEVYQQSGKKWKKIGTTSKTTLTVKKLKANKSYKFRVRAIRTDAQGAYSSVFTGKTVPLKTTLTLKAGKKALTASWKTVANITGYEVTYSTSKKFTKKTTKTVTIKKAKTKKTTIKKLSKGKKYYVKVRAYKTVGSKKIYSAWSSVKNVKVK